VPVCLGNFLGHGLTGISRACYFCIVTVPLISFTFNRILDLIGYFLLPVGAQRNFHETGARQVPIIPQPFRFVIQFADVGCVLSQRSAPPILPCAAERGVGRLPIFGREDRLHSAILSGADLAA